MSKLNCAIVFVGLFLVFGLANDQASNTQLLVALCLAIAIGLYSLVASSSYRSKQIKKEQ